MTSLKFTRTDIGFKELPDEVSLLVEISNCGNNCKGCHSPHLKEDIGTPVAELIDTIGIYHDQITAVCFLGHGTLANETEFINLLTDIRFKYPTLSIGLYSGKNTLTHEFMPYLDYYKVGEYIEELGGLESPTTNQNMYSIKYGSVFKEIKFYEEVKPSIDDRVTYESGGVKETAIGGKPKTMFQLIEPEYVEGIGDVLTMGAIKYSPDNWRKVDPDEYRRAMYHHMNEYLKGNELDEDSGQKHLYHLATNVMFLDWFDRDTK